MGACNPSPSITTASLLSQILCFIKGLVTDGAVNVNTGGAGTERTPAASVVSSSGSVNAGKKSITLIPSNDWTGTILGVDVGTQPLAFDAPQGDTLGAITYTRTTGSLTILTIT